MVRVALAQVKPTVGDLARNEKKIRDRIAQASELQADIVALGFDAGTVSEVLRMVDRAEYKRRQAPPGVRITPRAFGKDRRLPITNHYRDARP